MTFRRTVRQQYNVTFDAQNTAKAGFRGDIPPRDVAARMAVARSLPWLFGNAECGIMACPAGKGRCVVFVNRNGAELSIQYILLLDRISKYKLFRQL